MQPLSRYGRVSASWFQAQVPGLCGGRPPDFHVLKTFSTGCFHLTAPTASARLATRISDVARRRAVVCTLPPGYQPRPRVEFSSADDFPRNDFRFPSSGFHLTALEPTWALRRFCPASPAACSGLHATPASEALQSRPTPYRRSGSRLLRRSRGFQSFEVTVCSHEHPRRVGPFTVPRSRNPAACSVCRLPLSLRLTVRRSCR